MGQVDVADLRVAYDVVGEGPPILMINGIGADRTAWGMQSPTLSKRFQVITYDNRDVGETGPGEHPVRYDMGQFAKDAAGLLDALEIESAHIVGASMGGAIAQEFAVNFPDRTKSVTIVCSWPRTDPWMFELMSQWDEIFRNQGLLAWNRNSWLWVFTHRFYANDDHLKSLIESTELSAFPQSLESYLRQSDAFKRHDVLDRLPGITAPAHVICGEEDIYTPLRYSMEIANGIPASTLSIIPQAGHGMFWEATERFNQLVTEFIVATEEGRPFDLHQREIEEEAK